MTFRRRALVAALLQLPFAFSVAQRVWASTCLPGMPMDMGSAAAEAVPDHMSDMAGMTDVSAPADDSDHKGSSIIPTDCPLFSATGSCAVGAAIRALQLDDLVSPSGNALPIVSAHHSSGDLRSSGLFRPPRP